MRIRRYETVFMLPADLEEGKVQEILRRLDAVLERSKGVLVRREDWGVRKLAYEIDRHTKGRYFLMDFVGEPKIISELERNIKMIESILRYLTVKKSDEVDMDAVHKEQAEEKEKEAARKAGALQRAEEAGRKVAEEASARKGAAPAKLGGAEPEEAEAEPVPADSSPDDEAEKS